VHAGASCPSKRWPPQRFAQAADLLSEKYGADIVVVGGKGTEEISRKVISSMKRKAFDVTGKLSLGALAELLLRSRLFVSNDSGPVHVAVAVGTPVVAIFGRKDPGLSPRRWGPLGPRDIVLHKDVGCVKCLAHNCDKGFKCLTAVTVEDVVRAAEKILG
jgi:ADP-heptose:LPS heptosyltransferase